MNPGRDITLLIRKEARLARATELPKLSYELIEQTLQIGQESPWLLHDKALSLAMMGDQQSALNILKELQKTTKGEKLKNSIDKNIERFSKDNNPNQAKINIYLAKQSRLFAASNGIDTQFIPETKKINDKTRVKFLVFRKARAILKESPNAALCLADSILDYSKDDLAALQLKGEALAALHRHNEAIQIWKNLTFSQNEKIARKASELISESFTDKVKQISSKKSSKAALSFFIEEHLKHNLAPTLNQEVEKILKQLEPTNTDPSNPELEQHQLQLVFNTLIVESLEAQLRKQGRLNPRSAAQNPGAIGKTASKAG